MSHFTAQREVQQKVEAKMNKAARDALTNAEQNWKKWTTEGLDIREDPLESLGLIPIETNSTRMPYSIPQFRENHRKVNISFPELSSVL